VIRFLRITMVVAMALAIVTAMGGGLWTMAKAVTMPVFGEFVAAAVEFTLLVAAGLTIVALVMVFGYEVEHPVEVFRAWADRKTGGQYWQALLVGLVVFLFFRALTGPAVPSAEALWQDPQASRTLERWVVFVITCLAVLAHFGSATAPSSGEHH